MTPCLETVSDTLTERGFAVFSGGEYNLNLVGLRAKPGVVNAFDDRLAVFYRVAGAWRFHLFPMTTDPGLYWLQTPSRVDGTAILVADQQYRGCWTVGRHKDQYPALVQRKPDSFLVWRDANQDGQIDIPQKGQGIPDLAKAVRNVVGLNLHHAGTASTKVDKWSAACQVLARIADWNLLWSLIEAQVRAGQGSTFSYTLLEWPASDLAAAPVG